MGPGGVGSKSSFSVVVGPSGLTVPAFGDSMIPFQGVVDQKTAGIGEVGAVCRRRRGAGVLDIPIELTSCGSIELFPVGPVGGNQRSGTAQRPDRPATSETGHQPVRFKGCVELLEVGLVQVQLSVVMRLLDLLDNLFRRFKRFRQRRYLGGDFGSQHQEQSCAGYYSQPCSQSGQPPHTLKTVRDPPRPCMYWPLI